MQGSAPRREPAGGVGGSDRAGPRAQGAVGLKQQSGLSTKLRSKSTSSTSARGQRLVSMACIPAGTLRSRVERTWPHPPPPPPRAGRNHR
jgi:hypothetical protein